MKTALPISLLSLMLTLLSGCLMCPHERAKHTISHFDDSLLDVVIPHIELRDVSLEQAVQVVQAEWQKQIPNIQPPPVVIIRYIQTDENGKPYEGYPGHRIQLSDGIRADNITVRECLVLLTQITGQRFSIRSGRITIEPFICITEDWITSRIPVSSKAQQFMRLDTNPSSESLTALLETYGINFDEGFSAKWDPNSKQIVITTLPRDVHKLEGLLWLIDSGFEISRPQQGGGEERR